MLSQADRRGRTRGLLGEETAGAEEGTTVHQHSYYGKPAPVLQQTSNRKREGRERGSRGKYYETTVFCEFASDSVFIELHQHSNDRFLQIG
jgi:hypothetical protein